jgi:hypothetical protein
MAIPAARADTKNSTGSIGVYHSGCIFSGTIRNRLPREDWCSVESRTPRITSTGVTVFKLLSIQSSLKRFLNGSMTTGANSRDSTVV